MLKTLSVSFIVFSMARETYLPVLFQLFRDYGYEGVSLSKIAIATGLGKASLYHHFPGGKAEMVEAALTYSGQWFQAYVLQVLVAEGDVSDRLQQMCDRLSELYESGRAPCLLGTLTASGSSDIFHDQVKGKLQALIDAIATVLCEAGLAPVLAQQRAETAVVAIQGSLVVSRGLDDPSVFQRTIARLPEMLCEDL
ncbi:MAG: TetR/AcrR family transcriptional regulator [Phormidesmis sp.]